MQGWQVKAVFSKDTFAAALAFGVGVAAYHFGSSAIRAEAEPIFLTSSAIGLGTLATGFAGVTLLVAVLENARYRSVLELLPRRVVGAIWPYRVMGVVALAATLGGLGAALFWVALPRGEWVLAVVFALPPALAVWCIVGTWQLFEYTALHALAGQVLTPRESTSEGQSSRPTISSTAQR